MSVFHCAVFAVSVSFTFLLLVRFLERGDVVIGYTGAALRYDICFCPAPDQRADKKWGLVQALERQFIPFNISTLCGHVNFL